MGEHHLHSQSPRASHERKRACPQGACSILQARVTRRGLRVAPCAASAASEGRKGAPSLCFALSTVHYGSDFPLLFL